MALRASRTAFRCPAPPWWCTACGTVAAGRIGQRHAAHHAEIDVVVRLEAEAVTELFEISGSLFIATSPLPSMPEADAIDASACARFCRLICE